MSLWSSRAKICLLLARHVVWVDKLSHASNKKKNTTPRGLARGGRLSFTIGTPLVQGIDLTQCLHVATLAQRESSQEQRNHEGELIICMQQKSQTTMRKIKQATQLAKILRQQNQKISTGRKSSASRKRVPI